MYSVRTVARAAALLVAPALLLAQAPTPATPRRGPSDPAEVEAFIDGLMTSYLRDKHIAGATVSIVRDSTVLLSKGYGWSDVDKRVPVDGQTTLFRIGSISKTFTWTAIMQLVEQGKLDLNADINTYLDFKIPATYPEPITLTHVLTHTPGFEEDSRDLFTEDSAHITPMKTWLPAHMPKRVRAPGIYSSYSNWATGVAGYIVERVSGLTFDEYMEKNIFQPLGMQYASSRQPLPASLKPSMSQGYSWAGGRWKAEKFEIVTGAAPAGSFSVSASDMATFMQAHLHKGAWNGTNILSEATATRMQTRLHGHDPRIPGFAHGFYEQNTVGPRTIGHGGDTQWFHSDMMLLPAEGVGFFVSFNTNTGSEVSFKPFADDVFEHYYPEPLPVVPLKAGTAKDLSKFAGEYLFNRMSFSTIQKAFSLAGSIKVAATDSGVLVAGTPFGDVRLVQVDSLLFRDEKSHDLVAFQQDENGNITHGFMSMVPMMVLDKYSGLSAPTTHLFILGAGLLTAIGGLGASVVRYFGRHGRKSAPDSLTSRGRMLMGVAAVLLLVFLAGFAGLASNVSKFLLGTDFGALKAALTLPVLAAVAVVGAAVVAVLQWMSGAGTTATRVRHTLAVVIMLAFFWSLSTWNILGWKV